MYGATSILFFLAGIPIALFVIEALLAIKKSKIAIILPVVVACFSVILGFYALMIAALMLAIYFLIKFIDKEKQARLSEIKKMNIQDLD